MRLQVKISFKQKDVAGVFISDDTLPGQINVSNSSAVDEGLSNGARGFQLSASVDKPISTLDGSARPFPAIGYQGIITSDLSGDDGSCLIKIPFTLSGNRPENLYINFDGVAKEWAVDFNIYTSVSEYTIECTDNTNAFLVLPLAQLQLPEALDNADFTLVITKWSKPNASIRITRLSTYYMATYNGKDIISTANSENLLDSQMQISPGICEQYADIQLYDRENVLRTFAVTSKLSSDYVLGLFAHDDTTDTTFDMGNYIISDWHFDGISSHVGVTGRDKSYLFEKINIERSTIANRTLDELINILFAQAAGMPWRYQDEETRLRCTQITIPDNWYLASNLYKMLNKICALGMLRIYWYIDTFVIGRCC